MFNLVELSEKQHSNSVASSRWLPRSSHLGLLTPVESRIFGIWFWFSRWTKRQELNAITRKYLSIIVIHIFNKDFDLNLDLFKHHQ
jgi:hypothetical protein